MGLSELVVLSAEVAKVSQASKAFMTSSEEGLDSEAQVVIHLETSSKNLRSSLVKEDLVGNKEGLAGLNNKQRDRTLL